MIAPGEPYFRHGRIRAADDSERSVSNRHRVEAEDDQEEIIAEIEAKVTCLLVLP